MQLPGCKFVPASVATVVSLDPPRIRSPQSRQLTNAQEVEFNDFSMLLMLLALVALCIESIYSFPWVFFASFWGVFASLAYDQPSLCVVKQPLPPALTSGP